MDLAKGQMLFDPHILRHLAGDQLVQGLVGGGNRLFLDLFVMVDRIRHDAAWREARASVRSPDRLARSAAEHVAIAAAIARGDAGTAAGIMRHHLGTLRDALAAGPGHG